ncbi:MAG: helix-turn-helix transcriptional regulator [Thermodesulfobacteriota bacterium]
MNEIEQQIRPMVLIDGAKVKDLREKQGLTQLYMATAVGVTTETISRWENRRYPSIKGDNAEKLAEALGVAVDDILDTQSGETASAAPPEDPGPSPLPVKPMLPPKLKRHLSVIVLVALVVVALQVARYFSQSSHPAATVGASRILPPHVPGGQQFPILIRVASSEPVSFSLLLKENLPPGCEPIMAVPEFTTSAGKTSGQLKWVSRLEGDSQVFAYLLKAPLLSESTMLVFNGRILAGSMKGSSPATGGDERLRIANYHWADHNRDNRIDDEEILMVYDLFGDIEGFDFNRDLVDEIWASAGYHWNSKAGRYEVLP